ncbi:hypothetical protein N2W53_000590 [Clostridium perfringens]|uniref:hypothetical protein n=1 Tax=Clostridium perfringens TaxID=1502 RepID=UPI002914D600|nr:hypothetical protein [Clostridium perfringens]EJT6170041.1 hypothetical protein [Clostridium perfringens]EJT6540763.1 hypothetical protein [Clostridium perfringens]EJT6565770.1 hypothetical protein [Clostridium perfringens]MBS5993675.1 hypothetical protein [Clostridium perfringens]MDU5658876.1 hypothetical protein [Clostridium perfringens]
MDNLDDNKKTKFTTTLKKKTIKNAKKKALELDTSVADLIENALKEYFEKTKNEE